MPRPIVSLLLVVALGVRVGNAQEAETRAGEAYARGDYETAAVLYAEAVECDRQNTGLLYDGACSAALAGRPDLAFDFLGRALDAGFANADHLGSDPDLATLHRDPRWDGVMERTRRAAERLTSFWNSPALAGAYEENLTEDLRVAGLSKLWSEVKYNFANFDLVPDLDFDRLYVATLPRVRAAASTTAYYRVLLEFTASLRDGHTNVYPPPEVAAQILARPALRTRLVEDAVLVIEVFDEELRDGGLVPGLEVVSVDGVPALEYAETRIRPWQSASTPQDSDSRTFGRNLLVGAAGSPVRLELKDAEGRVREHSVERLTKAESDAIVVRRPAFALHELPRGILHVELNTFNDSSAHDELLARFGEIAAADGLVLDVRENSGGNSGWGWGILGALTDEAFATATWETRLYRPAFRAWGRAEAIHRSPAGRWPPHGTHHYRGPVVVLTSPRTYSAAEDFAVAFDAMDRGRIVGEATGGSTGQPLVIDLPGGGSARICTKRDRYPDGTDFVGVGVRPDVEVVPTVEDLRAGRDTVLEVALELLRRPADPAR